MNSYSRKIMIAAFTCLVMLPCTLSILHAAAEHAQLPGTVVKKESPGTGQKMTIPPEEKPGSEENTKKPEHSAAARFLAVVDMSFNTKDLFLGVQAGTNMFEKFPLYLNLVFYGRPYKKSVFVEKETNWYYQYKEYRFAAGFCLDKPLTLIHSESLSAGIFLSIGGVYTFGEYAGTKTAAEDGYIWFGSAGLQITTWNIIVYRIGYQYMPVPVSPDNRAYISVGCLFGGSSKDKAK